MARQSRPNGPGLTSPAPILCKAGCAAVNPGGRLALALRHTGYLSLPKSKAGALASCSFVRSVVNFASRPTLIWLTGTATSFSPEREDYRRDSCMINIKQRIFYLANRSVALVDLAADQLARPGAPRQRGIVNTGYRGYRLRLRGTVGLRLLGVSRDDDEKRHTYDGHHVFHCRTFRTLFLISGTNA